MLPNLIFVIAVLGLGIFCAVFPERAAKRWANRWTKRLLRINYGDLPEQGKTQVHKLYRIFGIIFAIAATVFFAKFLTLI
jgi:hypothetical protein